MQNKFVQISLYDTYKSVAASIEDDKPKLFRLLDEYIAWDEFIMRFTSGWAVLGNIRWRAF